LSNKAFWGQGQTCGILAGADAALPAAGAILMGRDVMFVRVGLGECAIILLLLLIVIAIVALGVRQRRL
jgi:hypothetical protein